MMVIVLLMEMVDACTVVQDYFYSFLCLFVFLVNALNLSFLHLVQTMERLRAQETGIFKKKPADLMQMFKVR
jgi:hypothetical protein